ncbi:MAG: hypothetical protein HYZ84_07655 [Candidatus Omnitrophica bacterium]|nr:hypothetical protein [Candidatus Omnitrophota bacterium]
MRKVLGFILIICLAGCVRLQGKAGYWHQDEDDEYPKGKTVGFDTQDIVQRDRREGSITT